MQATHLSHDLMPGPLIEVVSVVQHKTKAELLEVKRIDPLHRP
jgi:hypothetical protein